MKRAWIVLLAVVGMSFGIVGADAQAADAKKKSVAANKRPVVAKKHVPRHGLKYARKAASLEDAKGLLVQSSSALVQDPITGAVLFEKNPGAVVPIASITKLMTAMVVLDAQPSLSEVLAVGDEDVDVLKGTHSRLRVGTRLTREEMLNLALMSSENRAAAALSRHYPGGREAFVAAMNRKADALGLADTQFADPTGLTASNVSSARDLVKMVGAAYEYPLIREFSTATQREVRVAGRPQMFRNTNSLVKSPSWEIGLSKTGYINEAGKCLVMHTWIASKPTIIVLLDSWGKMTRIGDANRIKRWVESAGLASRPTAG
ncbi:MAG: D-alanyl-D-alanine endopeptidase [Rhodocyclales bacterium]|nr:D-alanyl-D-alanine endopeptidase [Rhodocyclales bacterium]